MIALLLVAAPRAAAQRYDLWAVSNGNPSLSATQVETLSGVSNFGAVTFRTATGLHPTDDAWSFAAGDWDGDKLPDLFAINRRGGSGHTEVHVLSGASGFRDFVAHIATVLHPTDANWEFAVWDGDGDRRPDLYAINRRGGSGKTELHVMSGASGFQTFTAHVSTALHPTDQNWAFAVNDLEGDGLADLYAINRQGGSATTEVHVLGGASQYQQFVRHVVTALHPTNATWAFSVADWNGDGAPDLVCVHRSQTGTATTEVHILDGAGTFQWFSLHTGTSLPETDTSYQFVTAPADASVIALGKVPTKMSTPNGSVQIGFQANVSAALSHGVTGFPLGVELPVTFRIGSYKVPGVAVTSLYGNRVSLRFELGETFGAGTYSLYAKFAGDQYFQGSSAFGTFKVFKGPPTVEFVPPQNARVGQTVTLKGVIQNASKQPIVGRRLRFEVNGEYVSTKTSDKDGVTRATYRIPAPGAYHVKVSFDGDADNYYISRYKLGIFSAAR